MNNNLTNIIIIWREVMNPSLLTFMGHIEGKVQGCICPKFKYFFKNFSKLVTVGQDDLILMWDTTDMTSRRELELSNSASLIYTCISYIGEDHIFVVGTLSGGVYILNENNLSDAKLIYQGQRKIWSVNVSSSGRLIAIGLEDNRGVIYDRTSDRFVRCDVGCDDGFSIFSMISNDQRYLVVMGTNGNSMFYQMTMTEVQPLIKWNSKFQTHAPVSDFSYNFTERPYHNNTFIFGGATTIQQISSIEGVFNYKIKLRISQINEIKWTRFVGANILVIGTQDRISIWNYVTQSKFHVINDLSLAYGFADERKFFGISHTGVVFKYENAGLLQYQNEQAQKFLERPPQVQENNDSIHEQLSQPQEQQVVKIKKPAVPEFQIERLLSQSIQPGIQSFYPVHMDWQFMFYNQNGCIIKRIDGDEQVMELQFHDKFKIRRIKFQSRGRYYCYYALTQLCFIYSTHSHLFFQMEDYHRVKKDNGTYAKQQFMNKWDYKIQGIEGVAIGSGWVAVVTKIDIRIFDLSGNQLHVIAFDRPFLAMAAYEDILAVAYSATLPLAGAHFFQLKLFKITNQLFKLERKTIMPVRTEQTLKWFGFSHQGCIFNQDTSETIRMYCWDLDQWVTVHEDNKNTHKVFIQHIQNYEIFGFRIEQKTGQPGVPTVIPRSLPRKIFFEIPECGLKFLTPEQNKKLETIYIRRLTLIHERFRTRRWYKNKFSRNIDHAMFSCSQKIKSQSELMQTMTQIDILTADQVKRLIPNLQKRQTGQQFQQSKLELAWCCTSLVFFNETISQIYSILGLRGAGMDRFTDQVHIEGINKKKEYKNLSRLDAMADMGWIERCIQE